MGQGEGRRKALEVRGQCLANRLTSMAHAQVLLREASRKDRNSFSPIRVGFTNTTRYLLSCDVGAQNHSIEVLRFIGVGEHIKLDVVTRSLKLVAQISKR